MSWFNFHLAKPEEISVANLTFNESEGFQNCGNVFKNCCRSNRTFGAVLTIVANVLTIVAEKVVW
uniref:Uncharacterized protein n=1 Tax=Ignavibacterium album TaxID=591197 RepID=A0A832DMJ9_9BACT